MKGENTSRVGSVQLLEIDKIEPLKPMYLKANIAALGGFFSPGAARCGQNILGVTFCHYLGSRVKRDITLDGCCGEIGGKLWAEHVLFLSVQVNLMLIVK
jgi:hypothetical protein